MIGGESNHPSTTALAAIGAASLVLAGTCLGKLALALKKESDFATIFHRSPSRDKFAGACFWITGASSGIGRALALHICGNYDNVNLILSSRRKDVLNKVADECRQKRSSNEVKILPLDLADINNLASKAQEALSLFGCVDILVNNGGVSTRSMARDTSFDVDEFVLKVDFLSHVSLTKALLPSWEQRTDGNFNPMIINTSSVAGKLGAPVRTSYCAAKHAMLGWFDALRIEQLLLGKPIDILNVVLGSTRTNIARNALVESVNDTFGGSDRNIESGLESEVVVKKVLAAAHAQRQEVWIAPKKELLLLYVNQYMPGLAKRLMFKSIARQYAVCKVSPINN